MNKVVTLVCLTVVCVLLLSCKLSNTHDNQVKQPPSTIPSQSAPLPEPTECTDCEISTTLTVNLDQKQGTKLTEILHTNVVLYSFEYTREEILDEFIDQQRLGIVLIDARDVVKDSTSLSDLKTDLESDDHLNNLVKKITEKGGMIEVVVANNMPRWLSSRPQDERPIFEDMNREKIWFTSPPTDYEQYEDMVEVIVHHYSNTLNADAVYTFGSEPDNYFVGNEEEFFDMYLAFARGALQANPSAKLGGPMPSNYMVNRFTKDNPLGEGINVKFTGSTTTDGDPLIKNFIEFSAQQNLPLYHISYHQYPAPSPLPLATADWVVAEKDISKWLADNGYHNTHIYLDDWPQWAGASHYDTEYQSAWVASGLASIAKHTSQTIPIYLGLRDLGAFSQGGTGPFVGATGMFTSHGIKKPVYNLYRALSFIEGEFVNVESDNEFTVGFATADPDHVSIVVSNFIPDDQTININPFSTRYSKAEVVAALSTVDEFKGMNKKDIAKNILDPNFDVDSLAIASDMKPSIRLAQTIVSQASQRRTQKVATSIEVSGISQGLWKMEHYAIDEDHANSYSHLESIENEWNQAMLAKDSSTLRSLVERINALSTLESGKVNEGVVDIRSSTYRIPVELQPNGVAIVRLSKQ